MGDGGEDENKEHRRIFNHSTNKVAAWKTVSIINTNTVINEIKLAHEVSYDTNTAAQSNYCIR